jgi:hypothetical protein
MMKRRMFIRAKDRNDALNLTMPPGSTAVKPHQLVNMDKTRGRMPTHKPVMTASNRESDSGGLPPATIRH